MKTSDMLAVIRASNDQEREAAKEWMRGADVELMSRFAQLAFGEIMAEVEAEKEEASKP